LAVLGKEIIWRAGGCGAFFYKSYKFNILDALEDNFLAFLCRLCWTRYISMTWRTTYFIIHLRTNSRYTSGK